MGKTIRILIAILAVVGLALLAGNSAAWAARPATGGDLSSQGKAGLSVAPDKDDDDDDCKKDKDKGKDKDKKKDKCEDDDDDGTVKPPPDENEICKRGDYSVGGLATLNVKKLRNRGREDGCFRTRTEDASTVSGISSEAGTVLTDVVVLDSLGSGSSVKICFAVPADKSKVKIYTAKGESWKSVKTSVKNGIACATVKKSGSLTLVGK